MVREYTQHNGRKEKLNAYGNLQMIKAEFPVTREMLDNSVNDIETDYQQLRGKYWISVSPTIFK